MKEVAKNNKCAKPTGSMDKKRKIRNGSASASKKKAPKVGASMLAKQNERAGGANANIQARNRTVR